MVGVGSLSVSMATTEPGPTPIVVGMSTCVMRTRHVTDTLYTYYTSFACQAASIVTSLFSLTYWRQKSVSEKWKKRGSIPHVIHVDISWTQGGRWGLDRAQLLIYIDVHASIKLESEFLKLAGQAEDKRLQS